MKALIRAAGLVASRVRLGDHELVFDQPVAVSGGENRGPSPLDVLVASIGACAHYFAAAYLLARGFSTSDLTVEIDSEKTHTPAPRIGRLAITVRVPPGLTEQQLAGIERAIKHCPAYATLVNPPSIDIAIEPYPNPDEQRHSA